jgi:hypothetical protein
MLVPGPKIASPDPDPTPLGSLSTAKVIERVSSKKFLVMVLTAVETVENSVAASRHMETTSL